jgi:LPS sulfotransferase NodH
MLQTLDDGRRFVLKAPAHCAELASLIDVFPDACVVHLHRDVVETIASGASLFAVFRSTYSDAVDPHDVGRYQAEQTALWLDRALAFRESEAAGRGTARFVDLDYRALVADPIAAVRRIYDAADLELTSDALERFARHRAGNRQHARGAHRYRPEWFGLDRGALHERFARYETRFGSRGG